MTAIHKPPSQNSKHDTTIAYQVGFYSWARLSSAARRAVAWHKTIVVSKEKLLGMLDESQVEIFANGDDKGFKIRWEYNNIPTQEQWHNVPLNSVIRVQFRISSLIGDSGRVAILTILNSGQSWNKEEQDDCAVDSTLDDNEE